ncbi:MAG: aminotransferase class IV [Pseudomonadota bacterium]|nr:aminotransferase class IV [Pseudomonadota bacterium]
MGSDNIIYLNGSFVREEEAFVPVTERGFFGGDGVYEVTRTFSHELFLLETHLDRLFQSLAYARIELGLSRDDLATATRETLDRNLGRISTNSDYAVWHVVTRGDNVMGRPSKTIVAIFCVEIEFANFAATYLSGLRLMTPGVRRTPPDSIDPKAKVLSRMNQIQAALEARQVDPGAIPLLLDGDGNITETNTGNFFFVADGKLHTSTARGVLGGITRSVILELADELGIEALESNFTPYDIYTADEAFVCSTTPVIMPVISLNASPIGNIDEHGHPAPPGPTTLRLMSAFMERSGMDYVEQAISQMGDNEAGGMATMWEERLRTPGC